MDSFELNKIAGAVLGTLLFVMSIGMVASAVFAPKKPAVPGYALAGAEEAKPAAGAAAAAPSVPLPELLAKADAARGQTAARACVACHSFEKGGANKVGPALWDVVGRAKAAVEGFGYSGALKERGGKGETWDYAALDGFLANPRQYAPGTTMAFAGISRPEQRADVIAYLRSLSDNPKPLPQ